MLGPVFGKESLPEARVTQQGERRSVSDGASRVLEEGNSVRDTW